MVEAQTVREVEQEPAANDKPETWLAAMQQAIRTDLNPLFRVSEVRIVGQLPRTASNKVMRRQLRAEYEAGARHMEERS